MKPEAGKKYSSIIYLASVLVISIGSLVVLGWVMDIKILTTIKVDYASMKFNTAVAFILSGIMLYYCAKNKESRVPIAVKMLAYIIFTIGALTLTEDIFNYNAGIDELLMTDTEKSVAPVVYPGRMSTTAAICFMLVAV